MERGGWCLSWVGLPDQEYSEGNFTNMTSAASSSDADASSEGSGEAGRKASRRDSDTSLESFTPSMLDRKVVLVAFRVYLPLRCCLIFSLFRVSNFTLPLLSQLLSPSKAAGNSRYRRFVCLFVSGYLKGLDVRRNYISPMSLFLTRVKYFQVAQKQCSCLVVKSTFKYACVHAGAELRRSGFCDEKMA